MSTTSKKYPTSPTTLKGKIAYYIPKVRAAAASKGTKFAEEAIVRIRAIANEETDKVMRSAAHRRANVLEAQIRATDDPAMAAELLIHLEAAYELMQNAKALPMFNVVRTKKEKKEAAA